MCMKYENNCPTCYTNRYGVNTRTFNLTLKAQKRAAKDHVLNHLSPNIK